LTDIDRYRQHLFQLAHRHHLCLTEAAQHARDEAFADVQNTMVQIFPVTDDTSYAVALHEMGHIVAKDGHGGWRATKHTTVGETIAMLEVAAYDRLTEECAAWAWAEAQAVEWTAGMAQTRRYSEGTYHKGLVEAKQIARMVELLPPELVEDAIKLVQMVERKHENR
jgi:hypothetical protein